MAGNVARRFVSQTGKFAALTIDVNRHPRAVKVEMRCFDRGVITQIEELTSGQSVEACGQIDMEVLKSKGGEEVSLDGYKKWIPVLTIKSLKTEDARPSPIDGDTPKASQGETRAHETRKSAAAGYGSRPSAFSRGSSTRKF